MHCVEKKKIVLVVKIGPYYGHFSRIYPSKLSIYLQIYVKNGHIFKTSTQHFFFNTVHNLIYFSMVFTKKNRGGTLCPPPPIITKVYLPLIITKVNTVESYRTNLLSFFIKAPSLRNQHSFYLNIFFPIYASCRAVSPILNERVEPSVSVHLKQR